MNKMVIIKDKIVLITGGASGIGARVVRTIIKEDVKHISILDIDEKNGFAIQEELNKKYGEGRVKFIKCDITREQELLDAFETVKSEHEYIDIVINNAGLFNDKLFVKEIELNFTTLVRTTLLMWDFMRKDAGGKGGTVINIASVAAIIHNPPSPVYSATKAAVLKFSTTLGDEVHYSRTGVRVLTICFGLTDTSMLKKENFNSFDPIMEESVLSLFNSLPRQTPEDAAQGLLEIYKQGKSGSVWVVTKGQPALDITDQYMKSNEVFHNIVFN